MADHLLNYLNTQLADAGSALNDERQKLGAARQTMAVRQNELTTATSELAEYERKAADIRKKLAVIPTPADGDALLTELEQVTIQARQRQAIILEARIAVDLARAEAEFRQSLVTIATTRKQKAGAAAQPTKQANDEEVKWKTALTSDPLRNIRAAAHAALSAAPYITARARIIADLPAGLRARMTRLYERRGKTDTAQETSMRATAGQILTELNDKGGSPGKTEKPRADWLSARDVAGAFANTARERLEIALSLLRQVADTTRFPLTPEQKTRINDAAFTPAETEEKKVADQQAAVDEKQQKLDAAIAQAIAGGKVPDDEQPVKDARQELTSAQTDLANAEAALTTTMRNSLRAQTAAAPGTMWQLFADFLRARQILNDLALRNSAPGAFDPETPVPGPAPAEAPEVLFNKMVTAEQAYVTELQKYEATAALLEKYTLEQAFAETQARILAQNREKRLFSALRGDY
ncbi:MAG: hypothetical protein ACKV2V_19725 [Blastocatellia bacterium]